VPKPENGGTSAAIGRITVIRITTRMIDVDW
jgi:hypothetical protein